MPSIFVHIKTIFQDRNRFLKKLLNELHLSLSLVSESIELASNMALECIEARLLRVKLKGWTHLFLPFSTQRTEGRLNLNFQAHPYGVAFLNP